MSYLTFHLLFILPAILLLWMTLPCSLRDIGGRRAQLALPLISFIALSYTTPWDNYLVAQGIWWYGSGRVLGTIGYVPVEEYLFFGLQPLLTGLAFFQYRARTIRAEKGPSPLSAWLGFVLFIGLSALGARLLMMDQQSGHYLGLILAWACPLLAGMWLYGGEQLWQHRTALLYAVGLPTLYLWVADAIAIRAGIWTISNDATLGVTLAGLPLEEATFFLVTNLLVVKGILLLLHAGE